MHLKLKAVERNWSNEEKPVEYGAGNAAILRPFEWTHPKAIPDWLPAADGLFPANPGHQLTRRDKKHRWMLKLERWLGWEFHKKHYRLVT
jgi:hypothetical protein